MMHLTTNPQRGDTMKIAYIERNFAEASLEIITQANEIIADYQNQGFDLTLRQLYYQFVARGLIANTQRSYKRLGSVINDGRLAGHISWNSIVDRTRNIRGNSHWTTPEQVMRAARNSFYMDKWENQDTRLEVWIEKDALSGVISPICNNLDVTYFSCRGYVSQSELWSAARRLMSYEDDGQETVVVHLGDHDPSGIDMTRDIEDRLRLFGARTSVERIALNMDQVDEQEPPPNPAKLTDSRCSGYIAKYGDKSWELDALEPRYMEEIIRQKVEKYRDPTRYAATLAAEKDHLATIDALIEKSRG